MWIVAAGWGKEVGGELKQKESRPASPTIQECTEAPVDTCQVPGTQHWPRPAGGLALNWGHPSPPIHSSVCPTVHREGWQNSGEHCGEEPPHIRLQDSVLKSLKVNQINREHRALESRCPGFPTRAHGTASGQKERQGTATVSQSTLLVAREKEMYSNRFLG